LLSRIISFSPDPDAASAAVTRWLVASTSTTAPRRSWILARLWLMSWSWRSSPFAPCDWRRMSIITSFWRLRRSIWVCALMATSDELLISVCQPV
jgi:hypothetical protein